MDYAFQCLDCLKFTLTIWGAPNKTMNTIFSLLATGGNGSLVKFHLAVMLYLNSIDRRKQTIRYTCLAEHLPLAVDAAKSAGVTLQKIERSGCGEVYPTLVCGDALGWRPLVDVVIDGVSAKAIVVGETKRRYRCKLERNLDTPSGLFVAGEMVSVPKCNVRMVAPEGFAVV